jgi:heme-degrading monooxygenase HmoA
MQPGRPYTSGDWQVTPGREEEFAKAWTALAEWSKAEVSGAGSVTLVRSNDDPSHFMSFGSWDSIDSINAWRQRPEFAEHFGRCREACDSVRAGTFTVVVSFD